jgi:hypothetical protein
MNREEMEKLYKEVGEENIDNLYAYSCLLASGFDKEQAFNLFNLLIGLWLKDENDYGLSKLSDMLYNIYNDIEDNINNMCVKEILIKMYQYE